LLLAGSLIPGQLTQAMLATPGDTVAAATLAAAQLGEELRLADVVDLAANVQAVLGGGGEPGGGTELWLSYKGGVGPQLSMEFPAASLAGLVGLSSAGIARSDTDRVKTDAEAGARVLELLSQAARFGEVGDGASSAAFQAQASAALGRMPDESSTVSVSRRDMLAVIAAVEHMPIEHIGAAWMARTGQRGVEDGISLRVGQVPSWLKAVAGGRVRVDLAWPAAEPHPQIGFTMIVRLGGTSQPDPELVTRATAAARQVELAGLLTQFDVGGYACPLHSEHVEDCESVILARTAAALRILAGMGVGPNATSGELGL